MTDVMLTLLGLLLVLLVRWYESAAATAARRSRGHYRCPVQRACCCGMT